MQTQLGVGADTVSRCRHLGLVLFLVSLGQTHVLACAKRLGVGAEMVSRCRHVGLVLFLVRLGQTHVLLCATQLCIDADTVRCRCRHSKQMQTCWVGLIFT